MNFEYSDEQKLLGEALRKFLSTGYSFDARSKITASPTGASDDVWATLAEMGILYRILDLLRQTRKDGTFEHEAMVIDLPATGHALALAELPRALLRLIPGGPIGTALREGLSLLSDPQRTGAAVVTLPETLPVSEAIELCAGLSRSEVPVAAIILNRSPVDLFTPPERAALAKLLEGRGPVLGARSLARIDRGKAAIERLQRELPHPLMAIDEGGNVPVEVPARSTSARPAQVSGEAR